MTRGTHSVSKGILGRDGLRSAFHSLHCYLTWLDLTCADRMIRGVNASRVHRPTPSKVNCNIIDEKIILKS